MNKKRKKKENLRKRNLKLVTISVFSLLRGIFLESDNILRSQIEYIHQAISVRFLFQFFWGFGRKYLRAKNVSHFCDFRGISNPNIIYVSNFDWHTWFKICSSQYIVVHIIVLKIGDNILRKIWNQIKYRGIEKTPVALNYFLSIPPKKSNKYLIDIAWRKNSICHREIPAIFIIF